MGTVTRTVAHALIRWHDGTTVHTAMCGQTVQLPAAVAADLDQFGAFVDSGYGVRPADPEEDRNDAPPIPDDRDSDDDADHVADADTMIATGHDADPADLTEIELPERPTQVSTKEAWIEYAEDLHDATAGRCGFAREEAEAMHKRDLIAALTAQLPDTDDPEER